MVCESVVYGVFTYQREAVFKMDNNVLSQVRNALIRRKENLMGWLRDGSKKEFILSGLTPDNEKAVDTVGLDVISKIDDTLEHIETGRFGHCKVCDGEIEPERLIHDFTTEICLGCYSDDQITELERDLELAAKVQEHLLPGKTPDLAGADIAVLTKPARIVSGDYYDFFSFRNCHQGLAIADVMGKGVSASMLMSNLQASLRILGPEIHELHDLTTRLNKLFRYNLKLIRFITLFLAALDTEKKQLNYCNAGHNPPLLWRAATGCSEWLKPTGPAIGLAPEFTYKSNTVQLRSGDVVVFYTDGLVEARNRSKEEFSQERVAEFMLDHHTDSAEQLLSSLVNEVGAFAVDFHDDLTVMVLKMA